MKSFVISTAFIFGLMGLNSHVFALDFTVSDADQKFSERSPQAQGMENAKRSAVMFAELYKEASAQNQSEIDRALLLIKQSTALYYVADLESNNKEKIRLHGEGKDVAHLATTLLHKPGQPSVPAQPEFSETLARSYYWLGANFGKWGLARGIVNSLAQWPELKRYMNYIKEDLKEEEVEDYGANRILGYAYFKLPFPLGDSNKSLSLLEEAYEYTLDDDGELSTHGINVLYYAEVLISKGQKAKAKEILQKFIAMGASEESIASYNPSRIPETKEEVQQAKILLEKI